MVRFEAIDPTTEEVVSQHPTISDAGIERALERAVSAGPQWAALDLEERTRPLRAAADLLETEARDLALLMATEVGKRLAEGRSEAEKCAWGCRYYADKAAEFLAPAPRASDGSDAFVRYEPLGPILAIMPWNFPFWQFFRFAAPALAAGNTILLKHAPSTPGCAAQIERLLHDAGLPAGVVQNLYASHEQAERIIGDPRIRGVTLTGSTRAGRQVAAAAGRGLKPMVMELGGSDAFVVLDDADLEQAIQIAVRSRTLNNGQSCIAAKRFIVHDAVYDAFREGFVRAMDGLTLGDPRDEATLLGPLARADLRDTLAEQVERSVSAGARLLCGGTRRPGRGFFYPATVLEEPPDQSPAASEELFGPVAALFRAADDEAAVARANATVYGLGCSLWTANRLRAEALVPRLDAGSVFVNGLVKSDPRLPFGGIKQSGFGRELGREGMLEFVNVKTVWIA
jgi:succinate-semialdehyde dehydrogenase/glutarate-semialdehyde dehydrogenase